MLYLLDTNTCIAAMRNHPLVVQRMAAQTPGDCAISTITGYELYTGVAKCANPAKERSKVDLLLAVLGELPLGPGPPGARPDRGLNPTGELMKIEKVRHDENGISVVIIKFTADFDTFNLPAFSMYNGQSIPYAYPPLAFYVVGILSQVLQVASLYLLRFVPVLFAVACIPAFHALAVEILESPRQAAQATLAFAFVPRTFDWLIMSGGVTRALGLLLALLMMRQIVRDLLWAFQESHRARNPPWCTAGAIASAGCC